jgi:DMSO reductase family type II enzyme heme b subunit
MSRVAAASVVVPVALALAGLSSVLAGGCAGRSTTPEFDPTRPSLGDGSRLFSRHCSVCHGEGGRGDGPAAAALIPQPRDLTGEEYALVSTRSGRVTRADLMQVLERGMPGSAMPSFGFLGSDEREALVEHVLMLRSEAAVDDEALALDGIDAAPLVEVDSEQRERGAELYAQRCASCHGDDGTGRIGVLDPQTGYRPARDFTSGILRGPATRLAITRRIVAGMPVAHMPGSPDLEPEDLAALVDHVLGMIPESAHDTLLQTSDLLDVARVAELPTSADDPAFPEPRSLVLSPLAWSPGAIRTVEVSGVHDGSEVVLRLSWKDPTSDSAAIGGASALPDAVAVQWGRASTDGAVPPLLAMGSDRQPVEVWFWQAFRPREVEGFLDAHGIADGGHHDASRAPAAGVVRTDQRARAGAADGPPSRGTFTDTGMEIEASAERTSDGWTVLLRRPLAAPSDSMLDLLAPEGSRPFTLAVAVWNGSAGDRRGYKSISTWQRVQLAD